MMRLVGQNRADSYMADFRLALFVLTGHDEGRTPQLWFNWWNDHQKDFAVSKELPELPRTILPQLHVPEFRRKAVESLAEAFA